MKTDAMKINCSRIAQFLLLFFFLHVITAYAQSQEKEYFVACVGYYNLENLFDTIDSPDTRDTEFTPKGKSAWTFERYQKKLNDLAGVISDIGTDINPDGPAVLGISEIENRKVVQDLISTGKLKDKNYQIVHFDSPDRRGIDVGLIYQPKYFTLTAKKSVPLIVEDNLNFKTRDQLVLSGKMAGEDIHFIVIHWPSRRGGEKRSRPYRNAAAELCRSIVDSLQQMNPDAKIMIMGDFNDNPDNVSVKKILNTCGNSQKVKAGELYNPMAELYKKGIGTTAWRDSWSLFDQIIVSKALTGKNYSQLKLFNTFVFNKHYLSQPEGRFEGYPWRTFAGGVYLEGYSDHFPVYCFLIKEAD